MRTTMPDAQITYGQSWRAAPRDDESGLVLDLNPQQRQRLERIAAESRRSVREISMMIQAFADSGLLSFWPLPAVDLPEDELIVRAQQRISHESQPTHQRYAEIAASTCYEVREVVQVHQFLGGTLTMRQLARLMKASASINANPYGMASLIRLVRKHRLMELLP